MKSLHHKSPFDSPYPRALSPVCLAELVDNTMISGGGHRSALSELLKQPRTPSDWGNPYTLWVHDDHASPAELILNPDLFPQCQPGDCMALRNPVDGKRWLVLATIVDHSVFRQRSFQVETIHVSSLIIVYIEETPVAHQIIIVFREQYIGRIPMKKMAEHIMNQSLYVGKAIQVDGYCDRAEIGAIFDHQSNHLETAIARDKTTIVHFQSETSKVVIFLEISLEMQHVAEDNKTFLEVAIDGFLEELFKQWHEAKANHLVSLLLCWRTGHESEMKDSYKVLADWEVREDWRSILPLVKSCASRNIQEIANKLVTSCNGCLLEALNLSLSMFDKNYLDRDLITTGMSVLYITAGNGTFTFYSPTARDLCHIAKRKSLDIGVMLNLICLKKPSAETNLGLEFRDKSRHNPYWINYHYYQYRQQEKNHNELPPTKSTSGFIEHQSVEFPASKILSPDSCNDANSSNETHCVLCSQRWGFFQRGIVDSLEWSKLVRFLCLPLECRIVITNHGLQAQFELQWEHSFQLPSENVLFYSGSPPSINQVAKELVDYRLALGFQGLSLDGLACFDALIWAHHIHIIKINPEAQKIHVEAYALCGHSDSTNKVQYTAQLWKKGEFEEQTQSFSLNSSSLIDFSWKQTDAILCGIQQYDLPLVTHWQSRFLLLPSSEPPRNSLILSSLAHEVLDDEEVRIAGFSKFVDVFYKVAVTRPSPSSSGVRTLKIKEARRDLRRSILEILRIHLMTSSSTQFAKMEAEKLESTLQSRIPQSALDEHESEAVTDVEPLSRDSDPKTVAAMMQHPLIGLDIRNRRWHWRIYRSVFVGSEAVDWILKFYDGIQTREEAVQIGNDLLDAGVWLHIFGTHQFLDGHYFYRFNTDFDLKNLKVSNPETLRALSGGDYETTNDGNKSDAKAIVMSRSIIIDLTSWPENKPSLDGRREWAILHYDSTHNPNIAFHFRLHWLTCPARRIDKVIQSWGRRATQCGFTLIEAPIEHPLVNNDFHDDTGVMPSNDPFGGPLKIKLAIEQEEKDVLFRENLILALMEVFHFVLDYEENSKYPQPSKHSFCLWSYDYHSPQFTQFIHESGVAIVQVDVKSMTLYYGINRLLFSAAGSRLSMVTVPLNHSYKYLCEVEEHLRQQFMEYCIDANQLSSLANRVKETLIEETGVSFIEPKSLSPSISSLPEISNGIESLDLMGMRPMP